MRKPRLEWTTEQAKTLYTTIEALLNQFEAENRAKHKMNTETFPIQTEWPARDWPEQLSEIPLALVQLHEAQALDNHCGQSLKRLAERQGLSAAEMVAVLEDKSFHERWPWTKTREESRAARLEAIRRLREIVDNFNRSNPSKINEQKET